MSGPRSCLRSNLAGFAFSQLPDERGLVRAQCIDCRQGAIWVEALAQQNRRALAFEVAEIGPLLAVSDKPRLRTY
jgi:hypothetical protein